MSLIHRITRHARLVSVAVALAATATIGIVGSAHAQVNRNGPHATFTWGDCSVTVGNVWQPNGAAVGGADISCLHSHRFITAKVDLWRRTSESSPFVLVRTSGWDTKYNTSWLPVGTWPTYCGGGYAQWDTIVTVNVDGSQTWFDLRWGWPRYEWWSPC
jgi:hypothetical protein